MSRTLAVFALLGTLACAGGAEDPNGMDPTPTPAPGLAIQVSPDTVDRTDAAHVVATGFPANATVEIGFGPPNSEYEVIAQAQSNAQGRVEAHVDVPDWAEPGRRYVFVAVMPDNDPKVVSDPVLVR